jgi:uncharacterized protein
MKAVFINLPVADLTKATGFYEAIGCKLNPQFSGDTSSAMIWSDSVTFQLLAHDHFATFTSKAIADSHTTASKLIALELDTRDQVDATIAAADAAGGNSGVREIQDMGFLYNRAVEDPDGHVIEFLALTGSMPE